ncbi:MAG: pyridoxal-phosphate dependent enzyme [Spirochaetaceae bacterium]|nr:MAG: pyridoxal-phosphate dependent enzyme [Spirochaetaceae bacterium]
MDEKPPSGQRGQDRERRFFYSALISQVAGRGLNGPSTTLSPTTENPPIPPLLDGAVSQEPVLDPDLELQTSVAADPERSFGDRIDAFQDIIDSEVGDTTLSRVRNIEREIGLRQIYLKFEGGNPTGTQKDRIAFAQAMDALRRGYDTVTIATCGNFGAAMALACAVAGLKCIVYIPEGYQTKRIREIGEYGAEIIRAPGDYETVCDLSRNHAASGEIYDANPGGSNTAIQLEAYAQIAYEIYDELRDAPAAVAVPVSNGTTLAGIYRGFLSLYRRNKTSRIPRMVAGSAYRKNPIVEAYLRRSPTCLDLVPHSIRETSVNEPLINWHSTDGDQGLRAIRDSGGWAQHLSDKSMVASTRMLRQLDGFSVLPASTAGLMALIDRHNREALPGDRYVAIITGKQA